MRNKLWDDDVLAFARIADNNCGKSALGCSAEGDDSNVMKRSRSVGNGDWLVSGDAATFVRASSTRVTAEEAWVCKSCGFCC